MIRLLKAYIAGSTYLDLKGIMSVEPHVKYQIDKEHPLDPSRRIRYGKYYEDSINVEAIISQSEYESLIAFLKSAEGCNLDTGEGLYIVYNTNKSFPITEIKSLPNNENLEGTTRFVTPFTFISSYLINKLPTFTEYGDGEYGTGSYGF